MHRTGGEDSFVSVVISTRNRGDAVVAALRSLMRSDYPSFEVVLVDQSDSDQTANSIKPFLDDPRLVYIRTSRTGLSAGRNQGTRAAQGNLIAATDDDCEPSPHWIASMAAAFSMHDEIGIVFGTIRAADHPVRDGMIPACIIQAPCLVTSLKQRLQAEGMGACMAYRRSVWEDLSGFDESLGPGALLRAGDDGDFAIRALLKGHSIYMCPSVEIVHHGFRPWNEARDLAFDYWYGAGASHGKIIKCRIGAAFSLLPRLAWRWWSGASPVSLSFSPSMKWLRLRSFLLGILAGLRTPVDYRRCLFLSTPLNPSIPRSGTGPS